MKRKPEQKSIEFAKPLTWRRWNAGDRLLVKWIGYTSMYDHYDRKVYRFEVIEGTIGKRSYPKSSIMNLYSSKVFDARMAKTQVGDFLLITFKGEVFGKDYDYFDIAVEIQTLACPQPSGADSECAPTNDFASTTTSEEKKNL